MSIPPIERALVPQKSQEASQLQYANQQKQAHAQDQTVVQYHNTLRQNTQQTVKMTKSENNEYRYDAKNKGNGSYSGKKQEGKKKQEEEKKEKPVFTRGFDIRI